MPTETTKEIGHVLFIDIVGYSNGRTIWIADAHRGDGKRFVVHAEEKLTAFMELEAAIPESSSFTHKCTVKRHSAGGQT